MAKSTKRDGASVGIWIRVSTDLQVDSESPERHEARARAYVEGKGWKVAKVYRLDAVSGKSVMSHKTTKEMIDDVRSGRITALVFSKLARLARNTRELLELADEFEKCEADLVSLQENIDTSSPAGRVFFTMIAAMAQWEREETSSRVAASVPIRAKLGLSTGGKPIYGYHWIDGELIPHPEEAPVRKLMYELYLEKRRKLTVTKILNDRGHRTRNGKKWTYASVGRLLADPTAKGERRANFTRQTSDGGWEYKDKEEWVIVPVEPIVSVETWTECNRIMEEGRKGHGLHKRKGRTPKYLFSGLVFCGSCGEGVKMYPQTGTPKYRCFSCTNKIPKDDLEALFIEQLSTFVLDDGRVGKYLSQANDMARDKSLLVESLLAERVKIEKRIESLVDLFQDGSIGKDEFKRQCAPLEEKKAQIVDEVPHLREQIESLQADQLSSKEIARDGKNLVNHWFKMTHPKKRELVENLLSKVTVDRTEIDFEMKYLPGQVDKKYPQSHLFNYAKGYEADWEDPNAEIYPVK